MEPVPPRRATPPPLPSSAHAPVAEPAPLSYFVPPPPTGWAVVGVYTTAEWHAANAILRKRGIMGRIGSPADEHRRTVEMLVPAGNEAYARSLLHQSLPRSANPVERLSAAPAQAAPEASADIPFATPVSLGLSPRQKLNYNIVLVTLWLILIAVALLVFVPMMFSS